MRLDCLGKSEHPEIRISYSTASTAPSQVLTERHCEQRVCAIKAIEKLLREAHGTLSIRVAAPARKWTQEYPWNHGCAIDEPNGFRLYVAVKEHPPYVS
jgi:hypothetical protein